MLPDAGYADDDGVAVRVESGVGGQFAGADLEEQFHLAPGVAIHSALANVGRTFCKGSDEGEDRRPCLSYAGRFSEPTKFYDVCVLLVSLRLDQLESTVASAPLFDVWSQVIVGLFGYPPGFAERGDQFACSGYELPGIGDPAPSVVVFPSTRHATQAIAKTKPGPCTSRTYVR